LCGGNTFPFAMGAVVDGTSCDLHTPLSGQRSPVRPVVPIGALLIAIKLRLIPNGDIKAISTCSLAQKPMPSMWLMAVNLYSSASVKTVSVG
ncbi:hypothetical protein, partial [Pseudomonas aeruginosa]|uniref:hypothetical protein n=1 Tax=Pseudomonas aeruginosa TaxID=287 RepID=UPI001CD9C060